MSKLIVTDIADITTEQDTLMSAFFDGESSLTPGCMECQVNALHQYYYYQQIRQTLRGTVMTSGPHETISWSQTRFTRLWARVDAAPNN